MRKVWLGAMTGAALAAAVPASANDVRIEGQVRIRYEGDDRDFLPSTGMSHSVAQRTRISADVRNDDGARIFIQLQDSRIWGDEGGTLSDSENVDLHQAFVRLRAPGVDRLEWILGRQELGYGNGRVVSPAGWNHVGRSFDAARLRYRFGGEHWVDVTFAKVSQEADSSQGAPGRPDVNATLAVAHLDLAGRRLHIEPLVIYKEDTSINQYLTSFGEHAAFQAGRFEVTHNLVVQTGKVAGHDASAHLVDAAFDVDVSQGRDGAIVLGAGFSRQSGDDRDDPDDSAYDNLFWTAHAFHGSMDLVQRIVDAAQGGIGLRDTFFRARLRIPGDVRVRAAVHLFGADQDEVPGDDGGPRLYDVGTELDLEIGKELGGLDLEIGGGRFSPGNVDTSGGVATSLSGLDETAFRIYAQGTAAF